MLEVAVTKADSNPFLGFSHLRKPGFVQFFDTVSSIINKLSQSIPLLMYLFLETLKSITETGYAFLAELIEIVHFYNFSISNNLTWIVKFPMWFPDCGYDILTLAFVLQWLPIH